MAKHEAVHGLPISNGYGTQGVPPNYVAVDVYCGRCKESYTPDRDWVARYFAARRKEVEGQVSKGYATRGTLADLDDERDRILAWVRTHSG